ncbi:MAG: hypothetical protein ACP5FX_02475 [Candidatus Micrarchaeia archaeon]
MYGIVERVVKDGSILLTTDGIKKVPLLLEEGKVVDILTFENVEINQDEIEKEIKNRIKIEIQRKIKEKIFNKYENEILKNKKFVEKAKEIAIRIKLALLEQRDFIVRFHADADGVSGALAFRKLFKKDYFGKSFFIPQKVACYSQNDLDNDEFISLTLKKPLLVFIDFSPKERMLNDIKNETIIIDHHPTGVKDSLNPWNFDMDSKITAGLLSCFIIKLIMGEDLYFLEKISLHGDRSELLDKREEEFEKLAIVVDYLITKNKLSSIEKILKRKESIEEIYVEAKNLIENAISKAKKFGKLININNYSIYILNLSKQKAYPQPGKIVSIFQERLNDEKAITMGISKNAISVRVGKEILKKVNIFELLKEMDAEFGGHKNAFSIRSNNKKEVLKQFLDKLKSELKKK